MRQAIEHDLYSWTWLIYLLYARQQPTFSQEKTSCTCCLLTGEHSSRRSRTKLIQYTYSGVMWPAHKELTTDRLDLQFGTNVAGHYALMKLLLPALRAASSPKEKARVVITSSMAAYLNTLHFGSFEAGEMRNKMTTYELYDQSKHVRSTFYS